MRSVELFAGAGGLALGFAEAGFHNEAVLEWDPDACETMRHNQRRGFSLTRDWDVHQTDVAAFNYGSLPSGIDLVSGGPPCQPFSMGGKHGAFKDRRDMFPQAIRAVRELRPRAFVFENVKGLLRSAFASYVEYLILQLTYPEITRRDEEAWEGHASRLERHHTSGSRSGLVYNVVFRLLNAANHGIPQKRERVVFVGFRDDLGVEWSFPKPTHSADALLRAKWVTGEYWRRHDLAPRPVPERLARRVAGLAGTFLPSPESPWRTVRDALSGLPEPEARPSATWLNHELVLGARAYPGHTGSPLDEPAKTLKAGDHGVPGGENMMVRSDGSVRYFTVRESARLQTFPDDYDLRGSWTESMRQLGNAVPVALATAIAREVRAALSPAVSPVPSALNVHA